MTAAVVDPVLVPADSRLALNYENVKICYLSCSDKTDGVLG